MNRGSLANSRTAELASGVGVPSDCLLFMQIQRRPIRLA